MLATSSTVLTGKETFEEAFSLIKNKERQIRYLKTDNGEATGIFQLYDEKTQTWSSPRMCKTTKDGNFIPVNTNTKDKLKNTKLFFDLYTKPVYAGNDENNSWLIGDIEKCSFNNEDYTIQGLVISSIFDPLPKFYISFQRLVCENQFGSLGTNNSSMYIDMNKFLYTKDIVQAKEKLTELVNNEIENRIALTEKVFQKLISIKLSYNKIEEMFKKLTVDTVAKNSLNYEREEENLARYIAAYNCNDNQNYKETFLGFVNTCTNYNSRTKSSPLDVIRPVISPSIINKPCNFEYLCRDVLVNAA